MGAAIVFRGHAHRGRNEPDGGNVHGIDWRLGLPSHRACLIEPARARFGPVDVFLCFYDRPNRDEIVASYPAARWHLAVPGASQGQTFRKALGHVLDAQGERGEPYDIVVTCRFDLELLCVPWERPGYAGGKVNFLWREYNPESWADHSRVPDALHMIPGRLLAGFLRGCHAANSEGCMHLIYRPLCDAVGGDNVNVMSAEYVNSNTDVEPNPFYRMVRT